MRTTVAETAMTEPAPIADSSPRRVSGEDDFFFGVTFADVGFASACLAAECLAVECFDGRWFMT
jgi:hypothetical protein